MLNIFSKQLCTKYVIALTLLFVSCSSGSNINIPGDMDITDILPETEVDHDFDGDLDDESHLDREPDSSYEDDAVSETDIELEIDRRDAEESEENDIDQEMESDIEIDKMEKEEEIEQEPIVFENQWPDTSDFENQRCPTDIDRLSQWKLDFPRRYFSEAAAILLILISMEIYILE